MVYFYIFRITEIFVYIDVASSVSSTQQDLYTFNSRLEDRRHKLVLIKY